MSSVLIVEDNADLQKLYQIAIRNEGHQSVVASDGQQALEILQLAADAKDLPRLILLDLMMPIMDGWQFLEKRGQDPMLKSIPVIVCSASREAIPEGVPFLRKPVDLGRLSKMISQICA